MKKCNFCKIEKPFNEFHVNNSSLDKLKNKCKECCSKHHKKTGLMSSEKRYVYMNSEKGYLTTKLGQIFSKSYSKTVGHTPNCTKEEIYKFFDEYVKQNGRNCYYCKEPWTYISPKYIYGKEEKNSSKGKKRKNLKNLSLDRLDSSKTYTVDNIIFCCIECNLSKKDLSISLIKRLYEIVTERNL
jgi:hypothetical protein